MAKYHNKINWKKEARLFPGYLIVGLWVAFTTVMLFWIICASLSSTKQILTGAVLDFSKGLKWENYAIAWNTQNVSLYFFNSLIYAIISCAGVLLISAPGAYVLSRWQFTGGKAIRIGLVIAMSVPTIMIIMPLYSLAVRWGIKGRILLVVLYIMLRVPYTTIYLLDFFSTLSRSTRRPPTSMGVAIPGHSGRSCSPWSSPRLLPSPSSISCPYGMSSSWP